MNDKRDGNRARRGAIAAMAVGLLVLSLLAALPAGVAQNDTDDMNATDGMNDTNDSNATGDGANETAEGNATELHVEAYDSGSEYWFEFEQAGDERNPTIYLEPGTQVMAHVSNVGQQVHNFHVNDTAVENCTAEPALSADQCATALLNPGENATLTFTVAEDAPETFEYWCDPHLGQGMVGDFTTTEMEEEPMNDTLTGDEEPAGAEDGNGVPGFGAVAALAAVAAALWIVARRRD